MQDAPNPMVKSKFQKYFSLVIAGLLIGHSARADITTGLVGYWPLSDGPSSAIAADGSGNGNTGALTNFADVTFNNMWTATTDPTNGDAYALLFNSGGSGGSTTFGTNTYVNIADTSSLD